MYLCMHIYIYIYKNLNMYSFISVCMYVRGCDNKKRKGKNRKKGSGRLMFKENKRDYFLENHHRQE